MTTKTPAELDATLRQREIEIALLRETSDAVTSQLDLEKLFQLVAERARQLIKAETLVIPILDRECEQYTYRAGCGKHAEEILGESFPLDFGVCGWVWRHKRAWWRGILTELKPEERNRWEHQVGTLILVPLIGKDHFLGGLAGMNKIDGGEFGRRDLELLTMFASQVAVALENAFAFDDLRLARAQAELYQSALEGLNEELVNANKMLKKLALYDSLTGLPNRKLTRDRLRQTLQEARREGVAVAALIADLDHFKEINDTLGHDIGDSLLAQVARRFQTRLDPNDTLGRLGGDEFCVVLMNADRPRAEAVANGLLECLDEAITVEDYSLSVSASIGIALYPEHGEDVRTMLKRADVAMYVAKRNASGYFTYSAHEDQHSPARLSLLSELKKAVRDHAFEIHYQPTLDLKTGDFVGVEALARWPHAEKGMLPPDVFIPMLERTGLIRPFTFWVLRSAGAQCAVWGKAGLEIELSVNLCMHNLRDPMFPEQVAGVMQRYALKPGTLVGELTESVIMSESREVRKTINLLRLQGLRFSIDDFGTGYSSLSRLKDLPVSELKIDRSFITNMEQDTSNVAIVGSTIELAHSLGLIVTAEGVESRGTLEMLYQLGCDRAQGYYLCRPQPAGKLDLNRLPLECRSH